MSGIVPDFPRGPSGNGIAGRRLLLFQIWPGETLITPTTQSAETPSPPGRGLRPLYAAETANAVAAVLLVSGLSFYTHHRFGWDARENFTVAACQGAFYTLGALAARGISLRWGRRRSLLGLYALMTACAVAVGVAASGGRAVTAAILAVLETGLVAASWPMLQSLVSAAGTPDRLSRRLGGYNILWSTTGAAAFAASGAVIQHAPAWAYFGIIAAGHLAAGLIILRFRPPAGPPPPPAAPPQPTTRGGDAPGDRARLRLALWLSRIALPSTYVIVYTLAPALPSLEAIARLTPTEATLAGGVWLVARAAAFIVTGSTTFWHRRPGLLLAASVAMILGFVGTVAGGGLTGAGLGPALAAMVAAQAVLGFSIGTIYAASLYFGMASSGGSTRHGGYHEALIGLGQVLGPLVGASLQWAYPGTLWPAVAAVSALVSVSVLLEAAVAIGARRHFS
jgi:MFS family permease